MFSCFSGDHIHLVRQGRLLVPPFSFALKAGEILLIQGENGRGKSSLLRLLAGLLPQGAGRFFWNNQETCLDTSDHRQNVAYMGHKIALEPSWTALEHLYFSPLPTNQKLTTTLEALDLAPLQHIPVRFLSQGQQQRVALCRLIISQRPLWLLDEPTSHLDEQGQNALYQEITQHTHAGGIVVLTSHTTVSLNISQVMSL